MNTMPAKGAIVDWFLFPSYSYGHQYHANPHNPLPKESSKHARSWVHPSLYIIQSMYSMFPHIHTNIS